MEPTITIINPFIFLEIYVIMFCIGLNYFFEIYDDTYLFWAILGLIIGSIISIIISIIRTGGVII